MVIGIIIGIVIGSILSLVVYACIVAGKESDKK